jgi:capsule polysaccharide export protein KpsE/RkpR
MQSTDDMSSWKQQVAHVSAQIEGLRSWFEREQRALSSGVTARLGQLAAEIHTLEIEPASSGSALHASKLAAQIEALKARGDLAYNLLLAASIERSKQEERGSQP